jgi:hypothetical protein
MVSSDPASRSPFGDPDLRADGFGLPARYEFRLSPGRSVWLRMVCSAPHAEGRSLVGKSCRSPQRRPFNRSLDRAAHSRIGGSTLTRCSTTPGVVPGRPRQVWSKGARYRDRRHRSIRVGTYDTWRVGILAHRPIAGISWSLLPRGDQWS